MSNIFNSLRTYAGKWAVKEQRSFNAEERGSIKSAVVVPSQFGNSVCFMMASGAQTYLPLDQNSTIGVGEAVDLNKAELITLSKEGESDIFRIKV